ncbi:MAG: N-acetylmuramoyl-L-alanine amidase [Candidatus Binatia bacterium]|nr:N-acetylmuramoyl-L-alanine amidase [Candidatus Binatia bacterium]
MVGIWGVVVLSGIAHAASDYPRVERIFHTSTADYARVVIALSRTTPHQLVAIPADPRQHRPARIVIDFSPARQGAQPPVARPVGNGLLTQIRVSQFSPTTVRVALDIERLDDYHTFSLSSPPRLILDVRGQERREGPQPSLSAPAQRYRIMLDPGHGGHDPGARGPNGTYEKDIVLALSRRLGRKLASRLPVEVLFTRTADVFVPLEERTARANAAKADLFLSIHANASPNPAMQGIETYYLNNTNDRATIRLAAMENGLLQRPDRREPGLSYILSDLIQKGKEEESIALAHHLQEAMVLRAKGHYPAVRNLGVKKGPFYVLVGAHMPCVLVEVAFLSHRVEGQHLLSPEYQEALAEGLFLGIARFLRTGPMAKSL